MTSSFEPWQLQVVAETSNRFRELRSPALKGRRPDLEARGAMHKSEFRVRGSDFDISVTENLALVTAGPEDIAGFRYNEGKCLMHNHLQFWGRVTDVIALETATADEAASFLCFLLLHHTFDQKDATGNFQMRIERIFG